MSTFFYQSIVESLDERRKSLGLSHRQIARMAGISHPTSQRLFSRKNASISFETVAKVAHLLGMELQCTPVIPESELLFQAARSRAHILAKATMEAMGDPPESDTNNNLKKIEETIFMELLRGSRARIWATP